MAAYGWNPYPRTFGGDRRPFEIELQAMLLRLEPGWDPGIETENYAELYAYALAVGMVWAMAERTRGQAIPARMLDALPGWEEVLRLTPTKADTVHARRSRVAAKLLGIASNTITAIEAAVVAIMASNFVELRVPTGSSVWTYWPGVNPGPPGLEWSSNRASVAVVVTSSGLREDEFLNLLETTTQTLEAMCPSWMTFCIGTDDGSGFVCSVGTLGLTMLGVA